MPSARVETFIQSIFTGGEWAHEMALDNLRDDGEFTEAIQWYAQWRNRINDPPNEDEENEILEPPGG